MEYMRYMRKEGNRMLCSKCHKNVAVIFITKLEGDKQTNEGLCLSCAKSMGIAPIEQFVGQMGIDDSDIDAISDELNSMMQGIENGDIPEELEQDMENASESAPQTMNLLGKMFDRFGGEQKEKEAESEGGGTDDRSGAESKQTKTATRFKKKKKKMLETYGLNLSAKAAQGLVDKVVGRDAEIDRVVQILNRRTKNNPVLLGEPGVGKTAIAEGLAMRIYEKRVPPKLFDREVYLLDFTAIVAGTQFRGQFEARLKSLIEEVKSLGNIILVIDELHNIVGAGDAEGAMSAANILKPALARGEIQVVGATTLSEYRKHIEKDTALERRFQTVIVDEPSIEDSIEILKGIREYYEKYHSVKISDDIIRAAVKMSERYITDRFLPDKAIDVIDEAGSRANLKNMALVELTQLEKELDEVLQQKEDAARADSIDDYQKAAELKVREFQLREEIEKKKKESENVAITIDDIAGVIEAWTKIPVQRITELESEKLLNLEERIHKRIIGQNEAVESVCHAVRRRRAGLAKKLRPVSFVFVGPTGVGKTELVKAMAEALYDNEEAIIRFDMSEYSEKHSVAKLIGAPPGYVGYDDAGQLTEKVRRKPYSIILLDEIEKAHPEIFNILLQILDDGRITDSHGKVVSFENAVIVMTSNAGSDLKGGNLGFVNNPDSAIEAKVDTALKSIFRPEFLNRIDEIVVFKQLKHEELRQIVGLMLADMVQELAEKGITLSVSEEAKDLILKEGYDPKYGARPIRRVIQKRIEDAVAHMLIRSEIGAGDTVEAVAEEGRVAVRKR